jgi:hypothetical protein
MRFLRHLAAATLVVAVVVVLGLAWNHFASGTLASGLRGPERREEVLPGRPGGGARGPVVIRTGGMNLGLGSMLDPVNLPVLRHTVEIEAGLVAAVVIIDIGRRRSRRAWRARQLGLDQRADDDPE